MIRRLIGLLLGIGLVFTAVPAPAAVDSTDILIKALIEKKIISEDDAAAIRAEIATIRQDEEAAKKSAPVTAKRPVRISGLTQLRYINAEGPNTPSTLEARRVRLTVAGNATPDVDYRFQVDFAGSRKAVTDNTFKTASFGKPILLEANIGYTLPGDHKITIGQQKVPFGLENLASSSNLDLINYAQVTDALVPSRDLGAQGYDAGILLTGARPLGTNQVEYALGLFNGNGTNLSDDNEHKDLAARLVWKPNLPGLALGADLYQGQAGANKADRNRTGLDATYVRGPWTFRGEWITGKDAAVDKRGWYATAVRTLKPNLQAALRYDVYDPNTDVEDNASDAITGGLTWLLSPDGLTRVQLNYERRHEEGDSVPNDQVLAQFQTGF